MAAGQTAEDVGMRPAISIDSDTGRKVFNTRAAKASEKIAGKGYSVTADEHLKELPPPPPGAVFNAGGAGQVPGLQRTTPGRGGLHGDGGRVQALPRRRVFGAADRA